MPTKQEIIKDIKENYSDCYTNEEVETLDALNKKSLETLHQELELIKTSTDLRNLEPIEEKEENTRAIYVKEDGEDDSPSTVPQTAQEACGQQEITTTHPKWTEYVMGKFTKDELYDKKPTCDGLRRVFELLIGEIISSKAHIVKAPVTVDPDATVSFEIKYIDKINNRIKEISDCFNINENNTKYPWFLAAVATAATKAEARALRKGLRLQKILSQEELMQGFDNNAMQDLDTSISDNDDDKLITDTQKAAITNLANRAEVSVKKLLINMEMTGLLSEISRANSRKILERLNEYQRGPEHGGQAIPEEIKDTNDDIML